MVPRFAAKLERVCQNLKKTTFVIYSRRTGKRWDQHFLTEICPGNVLVGWAELHFDSDPLTLDHARFFTKKSQNRAKSNPIFHLKGRGDTAWIFQFLDSPMAKLSLYRYLFFLISTSFMG